MNAASNARGWRRRVGRRLVTTAAAWAAAYAIVALIFATGGPLLARAPMPVRILVLTGILVTVMVNLLMPAIATAIGRLYRTREGEQR